MGCGKSKLDVASGNTIPQTKKSSSARVDGSKVGNQNGTEAKPIANNNVDNDVSKLEQKNDENVVVVDKPNVVAASDVITNVQQDNALEKKKKNQEEADVAENKIQEIVVAEEKDVSLENINQPEAAKDEKLPENGKEEVTLVKEVEQQTNQEETLVKKEKEEETKETNEEANLTKEEEIKETSQEETKETAQVEEIKEAAKEEEIKETAKEEETKEEIVVVANEEKTNETNVSTSEGGEEKDVKADEQRQ